MQQPAAMSEVQLSAWRDDVRESLTSAAGATPVTLDFLDQPAYGFDARRTHGGAETLNNGANRCTTGFNVWRNDVYGTMTAGHCLDDYRRYYNPTGLNWRMPFRAGHLADWRDFQWHATPEHLVSDRFCSGDTFLQTVYGIKRHFHRGQYVAKYGRVTDYGGSKVYRRGFSISGPAGTAERLVVVRSYVTAGGDSGGPWFIANVAAGIHTGGLIVNGKRRSAFSKFRNIFQAFPGMKYICDCS